MLPRLDLNGFVGLADPLQDTACDTNHQDECIPKQQEQRVSRRSANRLGRQPRPPLVMRRLAVEHGSKSKKNHLSLSSRSSLLLVLMLIHCFMLEVIQTFVLVGATWYMVGLVAQMNRESAVMEAQSIQMLKELEEMTQETNLAIQEYKRLRSKQMQNQQSAELPLLYLSDVGSLRIDNKLSS